MKKDIRRVVTFNSPCPLPHGLSKMRRYYIQPIDSGAFRLELKGNWLDWIMSKWRLVWDRVRGNWSRD